LSGVVDAVRSGTGGGAYREVRSPAGVWLALESAAGHLAAGEADALLAGRPARLSGGGRGRAPVMRFALGGRPVVGKRLVHGGLLGPILGPIYPGRRRAWSQAPLADRLRAAGVATPRVVASGARRVAGPFWRLALLTEEIPAARNLLDLARAPIGVAARRRVLDLTAGAVRSLHDAGFLHADLNLANLVLEGGSAIDRDGAGAARVQVIDLDRGRFTAPIRHADRVAMLARLLRSCRKWLAADQRPGWRERLRFLCRYAGGDRRLARRLRDDLGRAASRC
jgi:tRNA A-37 threonylcarbamoyl transferase component Bud32